MHIYLLILSQNNSLILLIFIAMLTSRAYSGYWGCGGEHLIATPLGLIVMCTGMATVRRLNGTDISVTDGSDVMTVGGEDTGVIRDSHWRDA